MNKVAVLTGASSGIGYAVAERLARENYTLVLGSRHPEEAAARLRLEHNVEVIPVAGDLAEPETTHALIESAQKAGGLDALLLNHGGPPVQSFMDITEKSWEVYFRLMVQGPLRLLRAAVPLFLDRGEGRVVAITSYQVKAPLPGMILSSSLRAALLNALKTIAQEMGPKGILVNAVAPGYIETERLISWNNEIALREGSSVEELASRATSRVALRRYGQSREIAEMITFLLSPHNSYVTGQQIFVDGGLVPTF